MENKKELYIVGAGGFGREIAWLVDRINQKSPEWELKGFIERDAASQREVSSKYKIVGDDMYLDAIDHPVWAVCAIGSPIRRKKVIEQLKKNPYIRFATLIDPSVIFSERVEIGEGCILCAGTVLTVDVILGCHVIVNLLCTIGHDTIIGDFVTVNPGTNLSGNVVVGACAELGTGMQVIQGRTIGKGSIVGAGAVVTLDIPEDCTAVGIPAKPVKYFKDKQEFME